MQAHSSILQTSRTMAKMNRAWLIAVALCIAQTALAHDNWISRGGYKNAAGEWCCGSYDCKAHEKVTSTSIGWMVDGELVPFDEAMPVAPPDGKLTICRRPDGTRRCVFGLKPGT